MEKSVRILEALDRPLNSSKGFLATLRHSGQVPSVMYGKNINRAFSLDHKTLAHHLNNGGRRSVFKLVFEGNEYLAIIRDIQTDPVKKFLDDPLILHVDFLHLDPKGSVTTHIPLSFINAESCSAIKLGGILNPVVRALRVRVPVALMPESFPVDVSSLSTMGSRISAHDLALPPKVVLLEKNRVVVTLLAPSGSGKSTS